MSVFSLDDYDNHEQVVHVTEPASGLRAIIAIHSTAVGPAFGGCRRWRYADPNDALADALRLSKGMSYKNALAGLPFGGGKAVILDSGRTQCRRSLFDAFGKAVENMKGRYITAEDVGTEVSDLRTVSEHTGFVSGISVSSDFGGDPSPYTALGVYHGIRASLKHLDGNDDLSGKKIAVQGIGKVGFQLCHLLHRDGARLIVDDASAEKAERAAAQFDASVWTDGTLESAEVDVLAPCALGATINSDTIPRIKARVIAGAANNQLRLESDGVSLKERKILYAPDFVINAGGMICCAREYLKVDNKQIVLDAIERIAVTLEEIFQKSDEVNQPTNVIANQMAVAILQKCGAKKRVDRRDVVAV